MPEQKKLLMVAYRFPPEGTQSSSLRNLDLARHLLEKGWNVTVLATTENALEVLDRSLMLWAPKKLKVVRALAFNAKKSFSIRGRYPGFLGFPDRVASWFPFALLSALRIIRKEKVSVVLTSNNPGTPHLVGLALKKICGLPWVADFHDPWLDFVEKEGGIGGRIMEWLERKVVANADRVVLTSNRAKELYLKRYPEQPLEKFGVVTTGFDELEFKGVSRKKKKGNAFNFMHVGPINTSYRDPSPFFKAFAQLLKEKKIKPDSKITLISAAEGLPLFSRQLSSLGIADNVEMLGRFPQKECHELLSEADCFLIFLDRYTDYILPVKTFTYAVLGKPVICLAPLDSDVAIAIKRLGIGITVEPDDEEAIKSAITRIYSGKFDYALNKKELLKYNKKNLAKKLAKILEEVTGNA